MGSMNELDYGGLTLVVDGIKVAATAPGQAGTSLTSSELTYIDGLTAGTATASKAVVLGASKEISTITTATITNLTSTAATLTTVTPTTVAGTPNFTGATTFASTVGVTGVTTPTGGVAAAGGYSVSPRLMHTGANPPQASTDFSDYTVVVTETIRSEVYVPANTSSTGVAIFNGSAVAGNLTAYLIDSTGTQVAATASTSQSGTDAYQRIAWTSGPIALKGPATYWVAVQGNNTGGKVNTHTVGNFGADKQTGTTYGTLTVATSPTTFTTALGPVASLY